MPLPKSHRTNYLNPIEYTALSPAFAGERAVCFWGLRVRQIFPKTQRKRCKVGFPLMGRIGWGGDNKKISYN